MPAAPAASKPVRAPALESYSSEGSDLDLPDAEALAKVYTWLATLPMPNHPRDFVHFLHASAAD